MNRVRTSGGASRHSNDAESLYWEQAADSIKKFLELRNSTDARLKMVKLNQAISGLPDNLEDYEAMKPHKKNFSSALRALKEHDESEVAAIDAALEHISVILALRLEAPVPQVGRNKRARPNSPMPPGTPQSSIRGSVALSSSSAIALNTMSSISTSVSTPARMAKGSSGRVVPSERLEAGRKVAFKQPPREDPETGDTVSDWILAEVKSFTPPNKYTVEDADDAGVQYTGPASNVIALPPQDGTSSSAFPDYPPGHKVLGMFPDTTVFYKSSIIEGPKRYPPAAGSRTVSSSKVERSYKVRFEDDGDMVRIVPAHYVVAIPRWAPIV